MKRQGKPCNTDPERARKRAGVDLRCAVRKLGIANALHVIADDIEHGDLCEELRSFANRYHLAMTGAGPRDALGHHRRHGAAS